MKTIKIISICLLLLFPILGMAQEIKATLNVQVFDAESQQIIKMVKVLSQFPLNKTKNIRTDFLGRAALIPITNDTITFDHPNYYHLHLVLHDHAPHDFTHPLKIYLTKLHPEHTKPKQHNFEESAYSSHHFEPTEPHHTPLKIGVIEDSRASEHRKSWLEKSRTNNKDFNLIDIHLRTKK